jgi:hypothetical protein
VSETAEIICETCGRVLDSIKFCPACGSLPVPAPTPEPVGTRTAEERLAHLKLAAPTMWPHGTIIVDTAELDAILQRAASEKARADAAEKRVERLEKAGGKVVAAAIAMIEQYGCTDEDGDGTPCGACPVCLASAAEGEWRAALSGDGGQGRSEPK